MSSKRRAPRLALLITAALASASSSPASAVPEQSFTPAPSVGSSFARRELSERVARIVSRAGVRADTPGCAVLVQRCGQPVLAAGFGLADVARRVPITPESRFELASVSKQFTALAILHRELEGLVSLSEPVARYVTELRGQPAGAVTLRQLLNHTGGVPDYLDLVEEAGRRDGPWLDNRAAIGLVRARNALRFAPGSRYEYTNSGYMLLGEVVARAGGTTYARYLREHLFAPLGMPDATVMDVSRQAIPNRVVPYAVHGGAVSVNDYEGPTVGDGGVVLSLRDFAGWQRAWTSAAIVPVASLERAWVPGRTNDGRPTGYGFGWNVGRRENARWLDHDGSYVGFRAYTALAPERGLMFVVLANRDDLDPEALALAVHRAWGETVGREVSGPCAP